MIRRPLTAFSAALVWLTGNVVVVMSAPTLFAHAPPKAPANGVTQDIASHEAAGALFGHVLRSWTTVVDYGPLPVLALAAMLCTAWLWQRHRRPVALVIAAMTASAVLCHGWGWSLQTRMLELLASLRAGTTEGSGWGEFEHLHRLSERVMGAETVALLVLTVLLAWMLMRLAAPLPSSTRSATV